MNERTLLYLLAALFLLSGCAPAGLGGIDAESTLTPTDIPVTAAWTKTPVEPTATKTPRPTSPTITMTPTISATPALEIPALTESERAERIQQLFTQNADCKFPCWWGVVPGITGTHDALQHISSFFGEPPYAFITEKDSIIYYYYVSDEIDLVIINTMLFEMDQKISHMILSVDKPPRIKGFSPFLNSLKIDHILTTYGIPSKVLLYHQPPVEPNSLGFADLWLVYEEPPGFMIEYTIGDPPVPQLCPLRPDDYLLDSILVYFGPQDKKELSIHYQYAKELDPQEFYRQMSVPDQCMDLPQDVWR
jgi:hypothetical protein